MALALNPRRLIETPGLLGSTRPLALALALTLTLVSGPGSARADGDAPQLAEPSATERAAPPEAKTLYEQGRDHFRAGRYGEAVVKLKAALAIDPDSATLLYNVAYTSELLGKLSEAIAYYEKYLHALPESAQDESEKTQLTLKRLRGRQSQEASKETPAASPVTPAQSSIGRADVWFWASLGGGAALLAGGAITGVLALKQEDDVAKFVVGEDGGLKAHDAVVDRANVLALSSDLLFAGGAVLVAGAALLYFLRDPSGERAPADVIHANLATDGKSAVLTLHGAF